MKQCLKSLGACILFAAAASAQAPSIAGVVNNYSGVSPGLPNYGIAQGSIFLVIGTNLVPSASQNTGLQNPPLKTTLNGVTVNVTVSGTTVQCILYYVTTTQIAAILPSKTPVGTGTLTVATSSGTSSPAAITVVQSAFGILTTNQAGTGLGQIQDANNNYSLLSYTNAAKPNDYIVLWGSGLGPVTGDETAAQSQTDFGSQFPIEVDVGGVSATVKYHGRSYYPGLDEVIVVVPPNISGCNVSVVVWHKNNNLVSNVVTMPVGSGGTCSDPTISVPTSVLTKCATSTCTIGGITVGKTTSTQQPISVGGITTGGGTTTSDSIGAYFYKYTPAQFTSGIYGPSTVSVGSCTVYSFSFSGSSSTAPTVPTPTATLLNAGTITATMPTTTVSMPYQNGYYSAGSSTGAYIPASGGTFSFSNGSGGPDIGTLSGASINMGAPLTWSSPPSTVTRSSGLTVNWTGGNPGTYVTLVGYSMAPVGSSISSFVGAFFWCTAPQSALSINVPATVLLALPASGSYSVSGFTIPLPGELTLANETNPATFTAPNLDYGYIGGSYATAEQVTFK